MSIKSFIHKLAVDLQILERELGILNLIYKQPEKLLLYYDDG